MKLKLLLLACLAILGASAANATGTEPGKKNDINGSVIESQHKKPVSDVNVTAFLLSKNKII